MTWKVLYYLLFLPITLRDLSSLIEHDQLSNVIARSLLVSNFWNFKDARSAVMVSQLFKIDFVLVFIHNWHVKLIAIKKYVVHFSDNGNEFNSRAIACSHDKMMNKNFPNQTLDKVKSIIFSWLPFSPLISPTRLVKRNKIRLVHVRHRQLVYISTDDVLLQKLSVPPLWTLASRWRITLDLEMDKGRWAWTHMHTFAPLDFCRLIAAMFRFVDKEELKR